MTQVRIRHEDYADPTPLCDVPINEVGDVVALLRAWGLNFHNEHGGYLVERNNITGHFVFDAAAEEAYFEVLIDDDEDD